MFFAHVVCTSVFSVVPAHIAIASDAGGRQQNCQAQIAERTRFSLGSRETPRFKVMTMLLQGRFSKLLCHSFGPSLLLDFKGEEKK